MSFGGRREMMEGESVIICHLGNIHYAGYIHKFPEEGVFIKVTTVPVGQSE